MYSVDCAIVGAGVIGLAVARTLAAAGCETIVIERNPAVGHETSSRNSEVIHAGLYYPAGSLKAITCVRGRELLYSYCDRHQIPHRRCGKLIVATDERQLPRLEAIQRSALQNGVDDLRLLSEADAHELEPALRCRGALLSPSTGIVDSHEYLQSLQAQAQSFGAVFAFNCAVMEAAVVDGGVELVCGADQTRLRTRWLVNCAGLSAVAVAERIAGFPRQHVPRAYLAKGNYYSLQAAAPFSRLIYPVPEPGGLGIHLTFDLSGRARFGPDVEWVKTIEYDVDPRRSSGLLRRDSQVLAGASGWHLEPRLCRDPAEDCRPRTNRRRISASTGRTITT